MKLMRSLLTEVKGDSDVVYIIKAWNYVWCKLGEVMEKFVMSA
jgi:hypothetical protein